MPTMSRWIVTALLLLAGSATPAVAEGPVLWDPGYAHRPTRQRDWVRRRVDQILAPTITFPALVGVGGRFQVTVRIRRGGLQIERLKADRPEVWAVDLLPTRRRDRRGWPCRVLSSKPHPGRVVLTVEVPLQLARDVYDLSVVGPGVDDSQLSAVRIHGSTEPDRFRFAVITDHQLWDPSARIQGKKLGPGGYPRVKGEQENLSITRQALDELSLWDPDFTLHLGDLVFGVNYPEEYDEAYRVLKRAALAMFAVPGNHDAYANYVVRLKEGALRALAQTLGCRKHLSGDLSWKKAWVFITCVYGDIKHLLYADLHRDGLVFWERQLGPPAYAFDHGRLHFVGINTYDGTPERRHAFAIYMDVLDLHLGAPAVDNYGGYLTDTQLAFIEKQAQLAASRGQTLVVFGHHDPRGNPGKEGRYSPNEPFPTDPIGLGDFEFWNYDSKRWDSDPGDKRSGETAQSNSAHSLMRILAEHGGYYLCGHVHHDARRVYRPGDRLPGGIEVKRRLEFITTTTAAASVRGDGYWGYRVIEAEGGKLKAVDYDPKHHLTSVPAGNLWIERGAGEVRVVSELPRPMRPLVRWELPARPEGYRFRLSSSGLAGGARPDRLLHPRVEQIQLEDDTAVYWTSVGLPGARFPAQERDRVTRTIRALPARGNDPPRAVIDISATDGAGLQPLEPGFNAAPGQPVIFSAERSSDPNGDRILTYHWQLGEAHEAIGKRVTQSFGSPGPRKIRLTLIDEAGARSTVEGMLNVQPPKAPPPPAGCSGCCTAMGPVSLAPPALVLLALLLVRRWQRDRRGR